jgi:hypothetical protein
MNFQQKTRLIELELINAGLKDSRLRLDAHELKLAASQLAVVHDFPTDGSPSVGMGGQTSEGWLRGHRNSNPDAFAEATGNVRNNNNPGGETTARKAARLGGLSDAEFDKTLPARKAELINEALGDPGMTWTSNAAVKKVPYAGLSPEALAGMTLEERLDAANLEHFRQIEASRPS